MEVEEAKHPGESIGSAARDAVAALLQHAPNAHALWSALAGDPFVGVQLVTAEGTLLYANDRAIEVFFGPQARASDYVGHNASEWVDKSALDERLSPLRETLGDGRTRMVRSIYRGRQVVSLIHRLELGERGAVAMIVTRPWVGSVDRTAVEEAGIPFQENMALDLGPLEVLSPRELEVLALLGEGMSMPEVAEKLGLSIHTVHDHRKAIGRKLHMDDRVRLAELAREAGLRMADAAKERRGVLKAGPREGPKE